jgi:RND family efflux transporter MFP subunit
VRQHRRITWSLGVLSAFFLFNACDREPDASDDRSSQVLPVLVEQTRKGPFRIERRYTGTVRAEVEAMVAVREPGKVLEASVPKDGDAVRKGALLLRLDSRELHLEIEEARNEHDRATVQWKRYKELREEGLVSLTEFEEKRSAHESTRVRLERLKLRKEHLLVKAPVSGIAVDPWRPPVGQYCDQGREVLRVADPSSYVVEVAVPPGLDEKTGHVRKALIVLHDGAEINAAGISLSAEVNPDRGGRILKLKPEQTASLYPGAVLAVRLIMTYREDVVTIPMEALVRTRDGYEVLTGPAAGQQGRVRSRAVVPGPDPGEIVVIESGLDEGAWVVIGRVGYYRYFRTFLGVGKK